MDRKSMLETLQENQEWDIIIIGGGATGLGAAVDAASRGYKVALFERYDFAKGTSSKATKLVHGGVRYLAQGNIKLVMEALKERGLLLKNAPHLTASQPFVVPSYSMWDKLKYSIGLKIYAFMSGKLKIGKTSLLSSSSTLKALPGINPKGLKGGVMYYDGQFDDARLALNLAQTAVEQGATVVNYMQVKSLLKTNEKINGVEVTDTVSNLSYQVKSKVVINATGVFTDDILRMDDPTQKPLVSPSQGIHLVTDRKFFPGEHALMIPKTDDGRVLFAVPWHNKLIIGTTDTPIDSTSFEPKALNEEIAFVFRNINQYLTTGITPNDISAVFAGLRPLVKVPGAKNTAIMPRDHTIVVSKSNLISITGGKWTTYRKMGKDAVNNAVFTGKISKTISQTEHLRIHGFTENVDYSNPLHYYGSDLQKVKSIAEERPEWKEKIHPDYPYIKAQVIFAVREEMAMTVEDILSRRIRLLLLDASAALAAAPVVATLMATETGHPDQWIHEQVTQFNALVSTYKLAQV